MTVMSAIKKGDKEVYLDHQTGQKVIVERKKD